MYDVVIRGGRVVTGGFDGACDVAIRGGRVVGLGTGLQGRRELDASGCLVLPGMIDMHVHFVTAEGPKDQPTWCDDFESGSAAALAGGITAVGSMTVPEAGERLPDAIARVGRIARAQTMADVVLHPVVTEPSASSLAEVNACADAGLRTLKMFMVSPAFDRGSRFVVDLLHLARKRGLLVMLHPEDAGLIAARVEHLLEVGQGDLGYYAESRPPLAEVIAVERAAALARATGAALYLVHVSLAESLAAVARARGQGARVYVETRPLYLHLTEERMAEPQSARYIGQPPLRSRADQAALWTGLAVGQVDTVGSDHAPWRLADKLDPSLTVGRLRPGVANLEWELPMLYSEGVRAGTIPVSRLVEVLSETPARLLGLYPRKGSLSVGSDADAVVLDPEASRRIGPPYLTRAGYSVFDGTEVTGWPRFTVRRGEVVFADGRVTASPGSGQLLAPRELSVSP